jgi:hypothetical protein
MPSSIASKKSDLTGAMMFLIVDCDSPSFFLAAINCLMDSRVTFTRGLEAALLDRAKRAEIENRLAIQRGELLPVQLFVDGTAAAFSACKAKFLAGPSKIRTEFPDLPPEVFTAMEQHAYDVLTELSSEEFARDIRKRLEAELTRVQAGTAANGKRVGGQKQKAEQ